MRYAVAMAIPDVVARDLEVLQIALSGAQLAQLDRYLAHLLEVNTTMNLTAVRDVDEAWRRLIVDSLTALPGMPDPGTGGTVIDIGTGAGLPGLPLAVALPGVRFTLLEATGKKARFVEEAAALLGLSNVTVLQERAETVGRQGAHRGRYDVAVSRAVGPMSVVLEYSLPLVKVGGRVLAMKGPKAERELDDASDALARLGAGEVAVIDAYPESFENDLVIVSVFKDQPTPQEYPRVPGLPRKLPL